MPRELREIIKDCLYATTAPEYVSLRLDIRALCAEVADRLDMIDKAGRDVYQFVELKRRVPLSPVYGRITKAGGHEMTVFVDGSTDHYLPVGQRVIVQPD